MPRPPLHRIQADAASVAEFLTYASAILDSDVVFNLEDDSDLLDQDDDEVEDWMMDDRSGVELLQLAGFSWAGFSSSLTGTGSRGPYNAWPKSQDFFPAALQSPDRWFRHLFRCAVLQVYP